MDETAYGLKVTLPFSYEDAVARTIDALKREGFGVLTTIDVKETLKQKLDVDFRPYVILGACNPPLAHRALSAEIDIGLLLPCNVIVYAADSQRSVVAALAPIKMIDVASASPALSPVAREADERLRRALTALETRGSPAP
jgi:uncharacterized protein (DUF302 family)